MDNDRKCGGGGGEGNWRNDDAVNAYHPRPRPAQLGANQTAIFL